MEALKEENRSLLEETTGGCVLVWGGWGVGGGGMLHPTTMTGFVYDFFTWEGHRDAALGGDEAEMARGEGHTYTGERAPPDRRAIVRLRPHAPPE